MTVKTTIRLPRTLVNELLHQAQISPNQEISGLIGRHGQRCMCYPIDSVKTDASVLFALSASEQLAALKEMKERNQELFAIYHSHPDAPALPSVIDEDVADYPQALYLIISLNTRGVLEMRGFQKHGQNIEEVNLII